jgi:hypothetical protein
LVSAAAFTAALLLLPNPVATYLRQCAARLAGLVAIPFKRH